MPVRVSGNRKSAIRNPSALIRRHCVAPIGCQQDGNALRREDGTRQALVALREGAAGGNAAQRRIALRLIPQVRNPLGRRLLKRFGNRRVGGSVLGEEVVDAGRRDRIFWLL